MAAAVVATSLLLVFVGPCEDSAGLLLGERASTSTGAPESGTYHGDGTPEVARKQSIRVRVLDLVSGEAVEEDADLTIALDSSSHKLFDGAQIPEALLAAEAVVRIEYDSVLGSTESEYRVSEVLSGDVFRVPLYARVSVDVLGAREAERLGAFVGGIKLALVPEISELTAFLRNHADEISPFETPLSVSGAISVWESEHGEARRFVAEYQPGGESFSILARATGSAVLRIWSELTGVAFADVRLVPGETTVYRYAPDYRPVVVGRLSDWRGDPVSDARVTVSTHLNPETPDFSYEDNAAGMGVLSGGQPGAYSRCTKSSVTTDSNGDYRAVVPRGIGYAAESAARGSYVFSVSESPFPNELGEIRVDLSLPEPTPENSVKVVVTRPDGSPFEGCKIELAIVDDFPYFRQFSNELIADASGVAYSLGLQNGDYVALFLSHEDLSVPKFIPDYQVVTDRTVDVRVPLDKLAVEDQ